MKRRAGILVVILLMAALMQLFCAYLELNYTRETLVWELKCETNLITMNNKRTRRLAEKTVELETKLKALTAGKTLSTNNEPAPAALF